MREGIRDAPGGMRRAALDDRALLTHWIRAFYDEAVPGGDDEAEEADRLLESRLRAEDEGYFVWEDEGPVSLAGYGGFTPNGARIAPVYTPPEYRCRGYATSLTAAVSAWLLGSGRQACFLYTDLANPTSNSIYQRIGYEVVCDSAQYRFGPAE